VRVSSAGTTRWSLVFAARATSNAGREALGELCEAYRPVVQAFFLRHGDSQLAQDRTQSFLLHFLESGLHELANSSSGSFRAFLFTALRNHWHENIRNESALKRSPGPDLGEATLLGLAGSDPGPERQFDHDWALQVFARARSALREEAARSGKSGLYAAVEEFLLESPEAGDYARVGSALAMPANTVAVAVKRLRERMRTLVQHELADTLPPGSDLAAEMAWLRGALRPD
jgi:DNA-directed RNA polymerase specialized sigma24 family protein